MGFHYEGSSLADLFDEKPLRLTAIRITERVGDELEGRVRRHTPVSDRTSFDERRSRRKRGTLKNSWLVGKVEVGLGPTGEHYTVDVYTEDPVAPHVEWDTQPHLIVPNVSDVLAFQVDGRWVYARFVNHPGTKGAHMMATALAETAASWERIAVDELRRWERSQLSLR